MDKMCKKSKVDDLNKSLASAGVAESTKRCESPVFKCINQAKPLRANQLDYSDCDIFINQINRSAKSRTTSKSDSEMTEIILPLSPIFSQVPLSQISQFQSPMNTFVRVPKNLDKTCQNKLIKGSVINKRESLKPCGIFESLGMTDKDISWVSSMASPPPKQVPGSEFNTVEKATFFPEEKFQNIQPRALFSPTFDEDSGCHPITFTSESDDDEAYKSNIRLSDVCATLKQLEVQSLEQPSDTSAEKIIVEKDCLISPIIRTEKNKKLNSVKKKNKGALVKSPEEDKYEFSIGEDLKATKPNKIKSSNENNFIEDDSFQSMSFSCLDELCKTVVTEPSNSSSVFNSCEENETLVNETDILSEAKNAVKKFYTTKSASEVYSVSSMDDLHSYAKALEEADKNTSGSNKINQLYTDKGIIRLDILSKSSETDAVKYIYSETISEKDKSNKTQYENIADENSDWEKAKQYLSESQLNVSDSEIFRTVENLEKTLASQESKEMERLYAEDSLGGEAVSSQNSAVLKVSSKDSRKSDETILGGSVDLLEVSKTKGGNVESSTLNLLSVPFAAFTTASGSKISVSEEALSKAKEILKDCIESSEDDNCQKLVNCLSEANEHISISKETSNISDYSKGTLRKGFLTASGKESKISAVLLEKSKAFTSENEVQEDISKSSAQSIQEQCEELEEKCFENVKDKFLTGSRKEILRKSAEALKNAKPLMLEFEEDSKQHDFGDSESLLKGFSTSSGKKIQVSMKASEKAQVLVTDCIEEEKVPEVKGFITGSGKPIQVSAQSLERAKVLMSECDEGLKKDSASCSRQNLSSDLVQTLDLNYKLPCDFQNKPDQGSAIFKNFSTGLGKTIQISSEALEKAKALMNNCEVGFNESLYELASEWIKEVKHQNFNTCKGKKTEANTCDVNYENPSIRERNLRNSVIGFSTALGHKVKVSDEAIEKAKAFWSKSSEIVSDPPLDLPKGFFQAEPTLSPLEIANRSELIRQEDALKKSKESTCKGDQNKVEDSDHKGCVQTSAKNFSETLNSEENRSSLPLTSGVRESDDWDEIIPSWLHVYSTSPSMTSDRIEFSPVISYENGRLSECDREFLVKSPVLGLSDRFYGRKKSRKPRIEENKKSKDKNQKGFVVPYKIDGHRTSMKRTSNLSLDFSVPFKKMKFLEDVVTDCVDVKLERLRARKEQEKIIKDKERVKPLKGSYLRRKCSEKQMNWMEAVAGSSPEVHSVDFLKRFGILEDVLHINIETAISFRFKAVDFFGSNCQKNLTGIPTGDGCLLILDDENNFGVEEVKRAFLASPGVQPNLVPPGWVENHFKWIVWKLAHYERSFPRYFGRRCLTPNHLLLQLKYRYDREIDRNERSSLKKILERDDAPVKRLVLCVCGIKKVIGCESLGYELSLTDGWYSCPARSDPAMTRLIEEGKLHIGTKLLIQGATLINCEQGVSPLEIGNDVYLKISTNSTRRIRWDAKLGFQKNPRNFPISLGSILPQGGQISQIDVIIVRVYPLLYMEKTLDGHHVTRNRRSEEKADAEYRRIQEQRMEVICSELQSEMSDSANYEKKLRGKSIIDVEQDLDLHQLKEISSTTSESQNILEKFPSRESDRFDREMSEKLEKRLQKEKLSKRNVTEFFRAKIVDFRKPDYNNPALLSIWNPNEDLTSLLTEGKVISLMNVTISNSSRSHRPLQINTTRQTQYKQVLKNVKYPTRKLTHLKDVSSKICPAFEEVDVVGMVVLVRDVSYGSRLSQIVYLTDLEMNFIGVVFWGNCKDYGWENVLKISSVVACSNLQWKKNDSLQDIPSLFVNENSVFSENPKFGHLKEEIERLKQNIPQDKTAFLSKCEEDVTAKLEDSKWRPSTSKNLTSDSFFKRTHPKTSRGVNGFESKPTASSTPIKPFVVGRNFGETEPSPIQEKIEKLRSYGEPPSLIPLLVRNNARRKFKKKSCNL